MKRKEIWIRFKILTPASAASEVSAKIIFKKINYITKMNQANNILSKPNLKTVDATEQKCITASNIQLHCCT